MTPKRHILIVLGAAVWANEQPSPSLMRRARKAGELWHGGTIDLIIASGGIGQNPPSEAEMIRRILRDHGVPAETILLEDQSLNTRENVRNSLKLIKAQPTDKITVVSDGYHLPRAKLTFAQEGIRVRAVSASNCAPRTTLKAFLRASLRESVALPFYLLKYR